MKQVLGICLALLVLTSCKTSFRITVREPAEIVMADSVQHILIVNNVNDKNSPDELLAKITQGVGQINGNISASEQCSFGISHAFNQTTTLKTKLANPVDLTVGNTVFWDRVDSLCAANQTQAIIEITRIESRTSLGGTVLANAANLNQVPLNGWMTFHVYTAKSHLQVQNIRLQETYYMNLSGSTNPLFLLNDALRKREIFGKMGYNLGFRAGNMFFEHWQWVNRRYYNKGSASLRRAKKMIRFGNWDLAEKQLQASINSSKNKVAGRSKYNMALVYEGQGRLDDAIAMAERAALENGTKLAFEYIQILQRRKNDVPNFVLK
jgi:hypothetical protein